MLSSRQSSFTRSCLSKLGTFVLVNTTSHMYFGTLHGLSDEGVYVYTGDFVHFLERPSIVSIQ